MTFKHMRRACALVSALVLSASLGACGTSDMTADTKIPGYDVSYVHKDDAIAAMVPKDISEDGVLTIGSETTYAPVEFVAQDGKTAVGFEIDLGKAIAALMGLKPKIVYTPFDTAIPSTGYRYDISISGFTPEEDRKTVAEWVYDYSSGLQFVVRHGNPKNVDTKNLCGHSVSVQTGTLQESDLQNMSKQCKTKGNPGIMVQSMSLQTDATTAVITGKSDAFFADATVANYAVKQTEGKLDALGEPMDRMPQAIAIRKGDMQTAKAVQAAINKLIDDGTYMKILKYWGVESGAIKKSIVNPKLTQR
ncbi:ABC transporter substrate-binding protein [Bifidobacterium bombi]|uniref:ABC transporter, solute-binding protein n=1 Tax=Bifidobacterium bombi DSM 19703 TaxID=1341695 RepID=A0A080N2A1_9BIFI|nr:ABC transporter substrate-binding protein [Bifidobacterium bombi]KFF31072.1 ABC transporter, solute-binding protein [Bifidobacterium bombi DSM 19703]